MICCHYRYVSAGGTKKSYSFVIPLQGCGTAHTGGFGKTVENIIVIQSDDAVQVSPLPQYLLTLTNSTAYRTRRFNAVFTRALQ